MPYAEDFMHRLRGLSMQEFGDPDLIFPMLQTSYEKDPFALSRQEQKTRQGQLPHDVPSVLSQYGTLLRGSIPEPCGTLTLQGTKISRTKGRLSSLRGEAPASKASWSPTWMSA
jgi:hypothetical protein